MKLRKLPQKINILIFAGFFCFSITSVFAQNVRVETKVVAAKEKVKVIVNSSDTPAEKSIAVDAKVNVSLCVSEGNLKVNGWERNEIRAFVSGGSAVGFRVQQKSRQTDTAVWVMVLGFDPAKNKETNLDECLSGEDIELDVPRNAVVNIKGKTIETTIESVGKVRIENVGGDIFLANVAQGIDATTYEGDVTVQKSGGSMTLLSTTGNITAFDVKPGEIGDIFKAKTSSGAITLQNVEHRQMEINSNSGSMKFTGGFQTGGQYNFGTQNGTILLIIPQNSSFKIIASYGYGKFNSEFNLNTGTINNSSKAQSLVASFGSGDATLNLTTYSGAIRIRKNTK